MKFISPLLIATSALMFVGCSNSPANTNSSSQSTKQSSSVQNQQGQMQNTPARSSHAS